MCGTRWRRGLDSNSIERRLARLDPECCAEQVIEQLQARCDLASGSSRHNALLQPVNVPFTFDLHSLQSLLTLNQGIQAGKKA